MDRDSLMTNCPNCGAPITGPKCEYCGTMFRMPESSDCLYFDNLDILKAKTIELRFETAVRDSYMRAIAAMRSYAG